MKALVYILRTIIGVVFVCSATFKLFSIDEFEIYVFSHNFLSFNLSSLTARMLIGFEFFIGSMLILNFYFRQIWLISFAMLFSFTIYLAIIAITGSTENCHCFGEILKMTPSESIIKNGIILLGLIVIRKGDSFNFRNRLLLTILIGFFTLSLPIIFSPPDFLYTERYSKMVMVNKDGLDSLVFDNEKFVIKCDTGKIILCFYSTNCRFCKLSQRKIGSIVERNNLDRAKFVNIFWGNPASLSQFYENMPSQFQNTFINSGDFMSITKGKMPLIILLENRKIIERFGYRSIDEFKIVRFLKQ